MRIASAYCVCLSLVCFSHLHHHGVVDCILHVACCMLYSRGYAHAHSYSHVIAISTTIVTAQPASIATCFFTWTCGSNVRVAVEHHSLTVLSWQLRNPVKDATFYLVTLSVSKPYVSNVNVVVSCTLKSKSRVGLAGIRCCSADSYLMQHVRNRISLHSILTRRL
jgi:hypothetical protein